MNSGRSSSVSLEQLQVGCMLGILGLSPWAFGCVHPLFELFLAYGLVILLGLWCARLVWEPGLLSLSVRRAGPAGLALGVLLACVAVPLVPMPAALTQLLSPSVSHWSELTQPTQRESLAATGVPIPPPNTALLSGGVSLNPAGNLQLLWRLCAVWLLFVASTSLRRPESALRQLAWAAAGVGSLLALVAMLQSLTPENTRIYWFFETNGTSYGPFLNRNHYPFWANLAIGLTLGLLFERRAKHGASWLGLAHDTTALWLIAALALQLCSLAMGLSRGGIASIVVAVTVCTLIRQSRGGNTSSAFVGVLVAASAVGLMAWAGFDLLESRLATLSEAETYREDGRWYLWKVAAMVGAAFPLLGSGGETFRHWETIIQFAGPWSSESRFAHRADNEYLDVFCEHGLLAAVALIAFLGLLLLGCWKRIRTDGLVAGGLVGLISVSLHSLVDFGLRIPASGVFATMVAGVCYAACRRSDLEEKGGEDAEALVSGSRGVAVRLIAPGATLLAIIGVLAFLAVFVAEKSRYARAHQRLLSAYGAATLGDWQQTKIDLDVMVAATPENVQAHIETARLALVAARRPQAPDANQWIESAIVHCVQARDVCPLAWEPQFWLAEQAEHLSGHVAALEYLQRGHLLHPSNPTIAYLLGLELHKTGAPDQAIYEAWAASLRKSTNYLSPILKLCFAEQASSAAMQQLAQNIREQVLPDNPRTLREAATLVAALGQAEAQQIYLDSAATLLEQQLPLMKSAERPAGYGLAAEIQLDLSQPARAAEYYRSALREAPQQWQWRPPLITTLLNMGETEAAEKELRLLELLQPDSPQIPALQKRVRERSVP